MRNCASGAYACHCRICQKSTGQPSEIGVPVQAGDLRFVQGALRRYTSSAHGQRALCGACGSRLAWQASDPQNDWLSSVTVSSLDDLAPVRVDCHIFAGQELPWVAQIADARRYGEEDGEALLARWYGERWGRLGWCGVDLASPCIVDCDLRGLSAGPRDAQRAC